MNSALLNNPKVPFVDTYWFSMVLCQSFEKMLSGGRSGWSSMKSYPFKAVHAQRSCIGMAAQQQSRCQVTSFVESWREWLNDCNVLKVMYGYRRIVLDGIGIHVLLLHFSSWMTFQLVSRNSGTSLTEQPQHSALYIWEVAIFVRRSNVVVCLQLEPSCVAVTAPKFVRHLCRHWDWGDLGVLGMVTGETSKHAAMSATGRREEGFG